MIDEHLIFMKALIKVDPSLANIFEYVTKPKDDNQIRTFEDCAKVEQEINEKLASAFSNIGGCHAN